MYARLFKTRFGWMALASRGQGVSNVILPSKSRGKVERQLEGVTGGEYGSTRDLMALESDFVRYFNGRALEFTRYGLDYTFSTGFQKRVWMAVHEIQYGRTLTYGEVAERIGESGSARAVGNALNANPLPVLVPCHRVVGALGVGGFSGGPTLKKRMLKLEGVL